MELHYVKGIGFAKKASEDGSISLYAYQESTPGQKHPRMVKIGHYEPKTEKLYIGTEAIEPRHRHTHENVNERDFDMLTFENVSDRQTELKARADRAAGRGDKSREIKPADPAPSMVSQPAKAMDKDPTLNTAKTADPLKPVDALKSGKGTVTDDTPSAERDAPGSGAGEGQGGDTDKTPVNGYTGNTGDSTINKPEDESKKAGYADENNQVRDLALETNDRTAEARLEPENAADAAGRDRV